jgi:hypothetical protein
VQVQQFLSEGVTPKDIGVIAPYNAQVKHAYVMPFIVSAQTLRNVGAAAAVAVCFHVHRAVNLICIIALVHRNILSGWFSRQRKRGDIRSLRSLERVYNLLCSTSPLRSSSSVWLGATLTAKWGFYRMSVAATWQLQELADFCAVTIPSLFECNFV